ncbi:hypothetical protein OY671_008594, partial [Metschnikowia pulcherrima]
YDWVCRPGEFITETPGTAHTLVTDDPNGMKASFHMQGANEFFDENGNHVETLDVWWFMNHYETYCRENNIPINPQLSETPRGTYSRNCWYVAAWASDSGVAPMARVFLEEPVALFRDETGKARAVGGRCPHRFAPSGNGTVVDGTSMCPYHGSRFDGAGRCVHNPHPGGQSPDGRSPVYPSEERHGLSWIWMGDPAKADAARIPDFAWSADPRWEAVRGATVAEGHYELYSDNILDLSHANFVHPA